MSKQNKTEVSIDYVTLQELANSKVTCSADFKICFPGRIGAKSVIKKLQQLDLSKKKQMPHTIPTAA